MLLHQTIFKQAEQASLSFISLLRRNSARVVSRGTAGHTTLLPYIHTKSQTRQEELSDTQARNQTEPNEKQQGDQHIKKNIY